MAPSRLPPVLALEIPLPWRSAAIDADLRALIRRMSIDNPLWGAPRIHGELLKLGFEVAQSSVAKYMIKRRGPPSPGWRAFLRNHAPGIAAMDLFIAPTIGFDLLYVLVIVRLERRKLVWINVTPHPTGVQADGQKEVCAEQRHLRRPGASITIERLGFDNGIASSAVAPSGRLDGRPSQPSFQRETCLICRRPCTKRNSAPRSARSLKILPPARPGTISGTQARKSTGICSAAKSEAPALGARAAARCNCFTKPYLRNAAVRRGERPET